MLDFLYPCILVEGPNRYLARSKRQYRECSTFVSHEDLFDLTNGLLVNDTLTILCKVKLLKPTDNEKRQLVPSSEVDQILNEPSSHTHVLSITHRWTITDYLAYFDASAADRNLYYKSAVFCPLSSSHKADYQFYMSLYPRGKRETDQDLVSIFVVSSVEEEEEIEAITRLSIVDKDGKLCQSKGL